VRTTKEENTEFVRTCTEGDTGDGKKAKPTPRQ
jgi:hypothetical protein